ncbi:hypothetical protein [Paenibacillus elgii]|uniref:hypothetical protein n=1 Tax=Paenibacillus elgii TaxID=189691 RepID=UPI00203CB057|nr:hypothetical protein [Paenibacillus elgii]MCM3272582.1 hypothetical protein [Paenibacillus elgii]
MEEISYEQVKLFPSRTEEDTDRTQILLQEFRFMKNFIREFEKNGEILYLADIEGENARKVFGDETHADKTGTAVIRHEIRQWRYNEYKIGVAGLIIAHGMIDDDEVRNAIEYFYLRGIPKMRSARELHMDKNTFGRRIEAGKKSIEKHLRPLGVLDRDWTF